MKKILILLSLVLAIALPTTAAETVRISVENNDVNYAISNKFDLNGQTHYEAVFHTSIEAPNQPYAVTLHRRCLGDLCSTTVWKTNALSPDWKKWEK